MLIITLILIAVALILFSIYKKIGSTKNDLDMIIAGITLASFTFSILTFLIWFGLYFSDLDKINDYNGLQKTIESIENFESIPNAGLILEIIEINKGLERAKYWNETIMDDTIPDELAELPFIEIPEKSQ